MAGFFPRRLYVPNVATGSRGIPKGGMGGPGPPFFQNLFKNIKKNYFKKGLSPHLREFGGRGHKIFSLDPSTTEVLGTPLTGSPFTTGWEVASI